MADPKPQQTVADFYTSTYLQTHMQRYQYALQMAQQQQASSMAVAQMLNEQLKNIDNQIADIKGAKSSDQFNRLVKAYGLKQDVLSDKARRQIAVYNQVNDIWNIQASLPTMSNAADQFASSLASAGTIESKARRYAGSVGGYSRGTDQAKAVAAATYSNFMADAYRKGYQTQFDASKSQIKTAIAQTMGVNVTDIDTAEAQKQKMIKDRLSEQGGTIISESDLNKVIQEAQAAQTGTVTQGQTKSAVDQLLEARTQIAAEQMMALQRAQQTPEQTIQQARNIYRSQFAPVKTQEKEAFQNYMLRLDPVQQMMMLGFESTKPGDVAFIKKPRQSVAKQALKDNATREDKAKLVAYDLFYAAQSDIKAGKTPQYKIHEKVAEAFPNDDATQQKVLGYILRAQGELSGDSIDKAEKRTAELKAKADEKYKDDINAEAKKLVYEGNMFQDGFDAATAFFQNIGQNLFPPPRAKGRLSPDEEADKVIESAPVETKTETKVEEVVEPPKPPQPPAPVEPTPFVMPDGTVVNPDKTSYRYTFTGMDANQAPQFKLEVKSKGAWVEKPMNAATLKEATGDYEDMLIMMQQDAAKTPSE